MDKDQLRVKYQNLADNFTSLCGKEKKRLITLSLLRLLVFFGGIVLTVAGFSFSTLSGIVGIILTLVIFLLLVYLFAGHSYKRDFYYKLVSVNINEIRALSGDYSLFHDGNGWIDPDHEFSNDVDLFGKESLFQYLNRTITGYGREVLAGWLSDPYKLSKDLIQRQEAIKELSFKLTWRQEFIASGPDKSLEKEDISGLLEWLNEKDNSFSSPVRKLAIYIFPGLAIISLILLITGSLHYSVFTFIFLFNLLLTLQGIRKTGRIHLMVSKKYLFLSSLSQLLSSIQREPFNSVLLTGIKSKLSDDSASAIKKINKLSRIIQSFDSRLNLIVGFVLNGLLLWDFHCIRSLEKWKEESVNLLPECLDLIGQIDAYISLANYSFNNQGYVYPELYDDNSILYGVAIGHPLINDGKRICNDFRIIKRGLIFIITGANMAGKSTFLRTIAINFILAMTGAPVCAKEMKFRPLKLFTSMRTTDSLSHNESYFYAELKRLKSLKSKLESGEELFFILDEILKGTNSNDKSIGSKLFTKKIIDLGGTGMIATHDTSLGEMEIEFPGIIFNKCFEIEIDGENIRFDYKLRDGITEKMNAALLMKQMGILE
jgi:ABC-type multidrug transport system fused ATPase/permease subunit